ncbi:MAG: VOC family protein [Acidobacteriota bacterium]|nr:VOC family protein [Acidobacteriota bacterium]
MAEQAIQAAEHQQAMPKHGEFCWNELATNNLDVCKNFYGELFGWKFKENIPSADGEVAGGMIYNELSIDGQKQFGGMYQMPKECSEKMPPHWMSYIAVDDVDETVQKVWQLGGRVCVPPTDIPNTGRFAVVNDPSGATFSLITLKR